MVLVEVDIRTDVLLYSVCIGALNELTTKEKKGEGQTVVS